MTGRNPMQVLWGIIVAVALLSCGRTQRGPSAPAGEQFFPEQIASTGWTRAPEIQTYIGDSLYAYIDGAAEMYHKYDFLEVSVADYRKGDGEIVAEVYRFADPDMAFGLYTTLRPDSPDTLTLGVEAFSFSTHLLFVRGLYMVKVSSYDESEDMFSAVRSVALALESRLVGKREKPEMFGLLPREGRLENTEKIFAESFLGQRFLTDVYSIDYALGDDRVTLFIAKDLTAEKFLQWSERLGVETTAGLTLRRLPFDDGKVLLTFDRYYGEIVAGLKAGRLVGMVGYRQEYLDFMADWLNSLP